MVSFYKIGFESQLLGKASIRPGYIIMREADQLKNDFAYNGYNVPRDITYHDALIADFFAFYNPKFKYPLPNDPPSDFDRRGFIY